MKRYFLYLLVILSVTSVYAQQKAQYKVKSGEVIYQVTKSSNNVQDKGKHFLYFKDYGRVQLNKSVSSSYTIFRKEEKGKMYFVDITNKLSSKRKLDDEKLKFSALEAFIKEGAKKIGTDKISGFSCDIWGTKDTKICFYKEVALKINAKTKNFKLEMLATSAKFDVKIPEEKFALPKY